MRAAVNRRPFRHPGKDDFHLLAQAGLQVTLQMNYLNPQNHGEKNHSSCDLLTDHDGMDRI